MKPIRVSNCCAAPFHPPGWPDSDLCSKCGEHAAAVWRPDMAAVHEVEESSYRAEKAFAKAQAIANEKEHVAILDEIRRADEAREAAQDAARPPKPPSWMRPMGMDDYIDTRTRRVTTPPPDDKELREIYNRINPYPKGRW